MGMIEGGTPSRFLFEIPDECLEGPVKGEGALFDAGFEDLPAQPGARFGDGRRAHGAEREIEDISQEEVCYTVGMKVHHNDFGRGIVRRVEGAGENLRVTVIFDGGGERKFVACYAPMRPV